MHSAIFEGIVTHAREVPRPHRFHYRVTMVWLDLDELDEFMALSPLFSRERPNLACFRRADYLAPAGMPLTLEYGRGTFLVLREDPVYIFRAAEGARLWLNLGYPAGSPALTAREVLDEASLARFRGQQRLKTVARLNAHGGAVGAQHGPCVSVHVSVHVSSTLLNGSG